MHEAISSSIDSWGTFTAGSWLVSCAALAAGCTMTTTCRTVSVPPPAADFSPEAGSSCDAEFQACSWLPHSLLVPRSQLVAFPRLLASHMQLFPALPLVRHGPQQIQQNSVHSSMLSYRGHVKGNIRDLSTHTAMAHSLVSLAQAVTKGGATPVSPMQRVHDAATLVDRKCIPPARSTSCTQLCRRTHNLWMV